MTARNPVRAKDRQHQSRFTQPFVRVPNERYLQLWSGGACNVLSASAELRPVCINSLFVVSRRLQDLCGLAFHGLILPARLSSAVYGERLVEAPDTTMRGMWRGRWRRGDPSPLLRGVSVRL
jgi:hypothetical protein